MELPVWLYARSTKLPNPTATVKLAAWIIQPVGRQSFNLMQLTMDKSKRKQPAGSKPSTRASIGDVAVNDVSALRKELDEIDREILAAINRRGLIAQQIGSLKSADGQSTYDPQREQSILQNAIKNNI